MLHKFKALYVELHKKLVKKKNAAQIQSSLC
jgi:hypothetical protein